jgi:hypothetical protein
MSRFGIFRIQGTEYDMDDLELDEMELVEDTTAQLLGKAPGEVSFSELNFGSSRVMKATAYVLLRRNNPDITLADVGQVKVIDFLPADEEMPETSPPDEGEQGTVDLNGSGLAGSGVLDSAVSTTG